MLLSEYADEQVKRCLVTASVSGGRQSSAAGLGKITLERKGIPVGVWNSEEMCSFKKTSQKQKESYVRSETVCCSQCDDSST